MDAEVELSDLKKHKVVNKLEMEIMDVEVELSDLKRHKEIMDVEVELTDLKKQKVINETEMGEGEDIKVELPNLKKQKEIMDAEVELPDLKKQKVINKPKMGEGEDIISQMPDNILHHILSFLLTECAVSTSILSKRWKDLWMSTTNLNFDCFGLRTKKHWRHMFPYFINEVLRRHSSTIVKFTLSFSSPVLDDAQLKSWICAAVERRVQEVRLLLFSQTELLLPESLCNSNMLTVLEVSSFCNLELPKDICLPNLKILRLESLTFSDDMSFQRLIYGLRVIEELELCGCRWDNMTYVSILLPTLKTLILTLYVRTLEKGCVIDVRTQSVVHLRCESDLQVDMILNDMPLLEDATIRIDYYTPILTSALNAANIFRAIGSIKSLTLTVLTLQELYKCNLEQRLNLFPMFSKLSTVVIDAKVTGLGSKVLLAICQNAPHIESIVIREVSGGTWAIKSSPSCFGSNLKRCTLQRFQGCAADIRFVKFMLKVSKVLESFKICCSPALRSFEAEVISDLQVLPKTSNGCVLEIIFL